jgi:hypothetical protein
MTKKFKKPPMAQAIRNFVAAMEFPSAPEHGANPNIELAGLSVTMLQFSNGLTNDATAASCSPSLSQIAAVLHCSTSTIKRLIKKLGSLGLMTSKRRGTVSSLFTIHKKAQQLTPHQTGQQLTPHDRSSQRLKAPSIDQVDPKTGQVGRTTGQPPPHDRSTVDLLWGKASGVKNSGVNPLEIKHTLEKEGRPESVLFFHESSQDVFKGLPEPPHGFHYEMVNGDAMEVADATL